MKRIEVEKQKKQKETQQKQPFMTKNEKNQSVRRRLLS